MKSMINRFTLLLAFGALPVALFAQQPKIANWRAYDQSGINVFEAPKENDAVFDGLKVRFGAGFTQQ